MEFGSLPSVVPNGMNEVAARPTGFAEVDFILPSGGLTTCYSMTSQQVWEEADCSCMCTLSPRSPEIERKPHRLLLS
jgi:hypothetical protein